MNFLGSAEDASNRVPPEMLPEDYFVRNELKKQKLVWAAEGGKDIDTKTILSLKEFKALMRIELRKFVSYPALVFFPWIFFCSCVTACVLRIIRTGTYSAICSKQSSIPTHQSTYVRPCRFVNAHPCFYSFYTHFVCIDCECFRTNVCLLSDYPFDQISGNQNNDDGTR